MCLRHYFRYYQPSAKPALENRVSLSVSRPVPRDRFINRRLLWTVDLNDTVQSNGNTLNVHIRSKFSNPYTTTRNRFKTKKSDVKLSKTTGWSSRLDVNSVWEFRFLHFLIPSRCDFEPMTNGPAGYHFSHICRDSLCFCSLSTPNVRIMQS